MAQKEGISFFEISAKTNENIKNMFYNAVVILPTFSDNNDNKENLIKELMKENDEENIIEGIQPKDLNQAPATKINVDGQEKTVDNNKQKKKTCGC